jgi:hypothetical protein
VIQAPSSTKTCPSVRFYHETTPETIEAPIRNMTLGITRIFGPLPSPDTLKNTTFRKIRKSSSWCKLFVTCPPLCASPISSPENVNRPISQTLCSTWGTRTSYITRTHLASIKTKQRNRLNLEPALVLALTKIRPRTEVLACQKQAQYNLKYRPTTLG